MVDNLLRWVLNREPVAAATGLAGVVTATIGVLAAWDVWEPTPEQIAAIATLITALAGYLARRRAWSPEHHNDAVMEAHNAYSQPAREADLHGE